MTDSGGVCKYTDQQLQFGVIKSIARVYKSVGGYSK